MMDEVVNFEVGLEWLVEDIDPSLFNEEFQEEKNELPPPRKRFKSLREEELDLVEISEQRYSKATKNNAKWGFNVFNDWCVEKDLKIDMKTVTEHDLNDALCRFYAEAQPKPAKGKEVPEEYHKNTMKNMRGAINRYIQIDCQREMNIVTDKQFKKANDMLNAKLKSNCREGLSRPTQHKSVIPNEDMNQIFSSLDKNGPVELRYKVWLQLSLQYCSRGLEFHSQLSPKSFKFDVDETGSHFVTISHETQQKNHQGDLKSTEENSDKRMYATGGQNCPLKTLQYFLSKITPDAKSLFTHINKEAITNPQSSQYWYTAKPVGQRQFSNFMPDICKVAGLTKRYTAHCLRATSLSAMTDNNVSVRHIMTLSDHSTEMSLVPYTRPSTGHKKQMSEILSKVYGEGINKNSSLPVPATCTAIKPSSSQSDNQILSQMTGFITNSSCSFSNCNFTFSSNN